MAVDRKWLYYTKVVPPLGIQLWKALAEGGEEVAVTTMSSLTEATPLNFGVGPSGIYFAGRRTATGQSLLMLYRFSDGKLQDLGQLEKPPVLHLAISPDEKWLLYTSIDSYINDLMLVDNFH